MGIEIATIDWPWFFDEVFENEVDSFIHHQTSHETHLLYRHERECS